MKHRNVMRAQAQNHQQGPCAKNEGGRQDTDTDLGARDATARSNMYLFLSTVYLQPPTAELLGTIMDEDFLDKLSSLFSSEAIADLNEYAASGHPDTHLSALKQEYMDLFAVPTGRYVAPFEDVYRGTRASGGHEIGPLMGERAVLARRIYREAGAEMAQTYKELSTHIGVELSFMGFLCAREATELRIEDEDGQAGDAGKQATKSLRYRELQARFLHDHVNRWFPELSQAIQTKTRTQFYRALARITEAFLAKESASLLPTPISNRSARL